MTTRARSSNSGQSVGSSTRQGPARRDSGMRPRAESVPGDGYDASEGPLESGLASESVDLSEILENAEADGDSLAVAPEDLGRRALQEAAQQDEPTALDESFTEEEDSLEGRILVDTDESD